jgi:hypothetical protein
VLNKPILTEIVQFAIFQILNKHKIPAIAISAISAHARLMFFYIKIPHGVYPE